MCMEDYILREIDKIGKLIDGLLQKFGIKRMSASKETVYETTKTELAETLNLDIDVLLAQEDFIDVLIREHDFSDEKPGEIRRVALRFRRRLVRPGFQNPADLGYHDDLQVSEREKSASISEPLLHSERVGRLLVASVLQN